MAFRCSLVAWSGVLKSRGIALEEGAPRLVMAAALKRAVASSDAFEFIMFVSKKPGSERPASVNHGDQGYWARTR